MYGAMNDGGGDGKTFLALGNVLNGLANTGAATAEGGSQCIPTYEFST